MKDNLLNDSKNSLKTNEKLNVTAKFGSTDWSTRCTNKNDDQIPLDVNIEREFTDSFDEKLELSMKQDNSRNDKNLTENKARSQSKKRSVVEIFKSFNSVNPIGDKVSLIGMTDDEIHRHSFLVNKVPELVKQSLQEEEEKQGTVMSSVVNLCATAMGAGVLSLPHAFAQCGIALALVMVQTIAIITDFGLQQLVQAGRMSGQSTMDGVAFHQLGRKGATIIQTALVLLLFGAMILIEIVIMDLVPPVVQSFGGCESLCAHSEVMIESACMSKCWWATRLVVGMIAVAVVFPLCLVKNISALRQTSSLALLCLAQFVSCITASLVIHQQQQSMVGMPLDSQSIATCTNMAFQWNKASPQDVCPSNVSIVVGMKGSDHTVDELFLAIPISAFLCQFNIFKIDNELREEDRPKMNRVIHIAIVIIAASIYCLGGGMGQLIQGDWVANNLLKEFNHIPQMTAARAAIGFTNMFKLPLILIPMVSTTLDIMALFAGDRVKSDNASFSLKFITSIVVTVVTFVLAYFLESISKILSLIGCSCGILLCFIMPAWIQIARVNKKETPFDSLTAKTDQTKWMAHLMIWTGVSFAIGGLFISGWDWTTKT